MSVDYRDSMIPWHFRPDNIAAYAEYLSKENPERAYGGTHSGSSQHRKAKPHGGGSVTEMIHQRKKTRRK